MSYWSKRQEELNKALEKDEAKLKKRLAKMYAEESRRLERQIAAYYEMYGEDDVIAYRKLLEDLSEEDKRLLMEEMDEFAEKYPEYRDLMPIRESVYNLDRLEGLQYSLQMQQLRIGAKEQDMIKQHLIENAYRSANAAAEAMGFGTKFYSMNSNIMSRFVGVPWADGRSFSDRIWDNKKKLTNYLSRDLAQGMARGDSYEQLVKNITERFGNVSKNDAYRLVYTEGTYVMAESSMMPFEEDFQFYKLSTVGDDKVCSICRGLENGEPMPIEKRVPGENFPPLHPWCRCTFTIEVEDWDKWMDDYVAKHGEEQALQVAENMNANFLINTEDGVDGRMVGQERRNIFTALRESPSKVREAAKSSEIRITSEPVSSYDYKKDIIYIAKGAGVRDVHHELGHMFENKVLGESAANKIKRNRYRDVTAWNIQHKTMHDNLGGEIEVIYLSHKNQVSDYQGRVYAKSRVDAFDKDGNIKVELMKEYISEPYRVYIEDPQRLKHIDPEMYNLIKEALK